MAEPRRRPRDLALGAAIWLALGGGAIAAARARAESIGPPTAKIARWLASPTRTIEARLSHRLDVGDPVLDPTRGYLGRVAAIRDPSGQSVWSTVAVVGTSLESSLAATTTFSVTLAIDPEVTLPASWVATTGGSSGSGAWIIATLLPPAKREMALREVEAFVGEHRAEVEAFLRPLAEDVIAHGMGVLEENLNAALEARHDEIQALLDEHRVLVKDDLLPVLKRRLGPSAKAKAEPLLRDIGRKLWDELPIASFTWSAVVDRIPGTSHQRMDAWWAEFVETKAIPIVSAHEQDLMKALEELIEEGARDPEVRAALGVATRRLAADPRFKSLMRGIIEDALVRPFDVRALVAKVSSDPAHRARFERLQELISPTLQRIGHRLTVDPETGKIDPDLVRVLRRVVLNKDLRWVELAPVGAVPSAGP